MSHDVKLETLDVEPISIFFHNGNEDCLTTDQDVEVGRLGSEWVDKEATIRVGGNSQ